MGQQGEKARVQTGAAGRGGGVGCDSLHVPLRRFKIMHIVGLFDGNTQYNTQNIITRIPKLFTMEALISIPFPF